MKAPAALIAVSLLVLGCAMPQRTPAAKDVSFAAIQRGKYLVDAGDCKDCHTADESKPFAGGRALETPFGTIYSSNITPDKKTGIGNWSDDDFYRAMHTGIGADGEHLYPAFPYPYFTRMPRSDVDDMRAYLDTLTPIPNESPENDLTWPLNYRFLVWGWNLLYFDSGTFTPNPQKSPEWNRGAYLVEGPGHCGACHTPKTWFGGDENGSNYLRGGVLENWHAPNITNAKGDGLGSWSEDDIAQFLKTGRNAKSGATGTMGEVVHYSTSRLTDSDLHAIAVYLKSVPGNQSAPQTSKPQDKVMAAGKGIYEDSCAACHRDSGDGVPFMFPPLKGNANVLAENPTTLIRITLEGAQTQPTDKEPTPSAMPAYDWKLDDDEIAAVITYIRNAWGNAAPAVGASDVRDLRQKLHEMKSASSGD